MEGITAGGRFDEGPVCDSSARVLLTLPLSPSFPLSPSHQLGLEAALKGIQWQLKGKSWEGAGKHLRCLNEGSG